MANHFHDGVTARSPGDATFMSDTTGAGMTFAAMRRRVAQMAGALAAQGIVPGDRVAAQIEKSTEGLMLYLGTLQAGAVFLPLNTAYTPSELAYFLGDAEPRLVVCDPTRIEAVSAVAGDAMVLTLDGEGRGSLPAIADAMPDTFQTVPRDADDLAAILYTSGTTGRSKGAMLTHANLVSNATTLVATWRITASDRLLHALPIYHTHGLFVACNTVLVAGASLIFMPKFETGAMIAAMPEATLMMGVPTFYTRLLDSFDFSVETVRTIRLFVSGSAPLLAETHRAWRERTGHAILERYGMTETNMTTSNPYEGERRAGTVGHPLPGVDVRIADPDTGVVLDRGSIGMIEVKGPNVFQGYWRNPEKTAAEFRPDGFFITGDLGTIDDDGYVSIVGRGKDLIITGGLNVYPKEIEREIDAVPGVQESAVIGVPDDDFGESVTAIVVMEHGAALEEATVLDSLAGKLAKFKLPKRVIFITDLPRNTMGKVQKNVLRETYGTVPAS